MKLIQRPREREAWLALRRGYVGASEQAALWGVSPWTTILDLWHDKRGTNPTPKEDMTARMRAGLYFEDAIAKFICNEHGLEGFRNESYVIHDDVEGMGATPDWWVLVPSERPEIKRYAPLQIKNVDGYVFNEEWRDDDRKVAAPAHIELQVAHELSISGAPYGYVGALVNGNRTELVRIDADPQVIASCEQRVAAFWKSVREGKEPPPTPPVDKQLLTRLRLAAGGGLVDMTGNADLEDVIRAYDAASKLRKNMEDECDRLVMRALEMIGDANKVKTGAGSISANVIAEKPERTQTVSAQPAYRNIRIYPKKSKAQP